ncbi:uncharacterized protein LOC128727350 [Anopheles nili]|uniref:uncharacterized protein LOC128727350 n=1 Tax=Anopheles nili TaxID=185578 RepID=UPI00237A7201|nr:uncharacterized protein LOC128727350 [Anopheles nili]
MEQNIFDVSDDISFPWLPAYAEATEANPLNSASSRMLETIVEETSDDDDGRDKEQSHGQQPLSWSQYDQVWSSGGSDAESVIRVETPSDQDTMSERDFICPPKRRKQETAFGDEFLSSDLSAIYGRRPRICEPDGLDGNEYFMKRHNEQRLRFDEIGHDLFTDSDSLSYASLSRSSSLIQFESLERQLQNETTVNQHPLSGSSPSLYTTEPIGHGGELAGPGGVSSIARATDALTGYGYGPGGSARTKPVGVPTGPGGPASNLLTTTNLIQKSIAQTALNISDSELYSTSSSVSSTGSCSGPDSSSNASTGNSSSSSSSSSTASSRSSGFRYTDGGAGIQGTNDRLERSPRGVGGTTTPEDTGDTEEELLSATVRCHSTRCSERQRHGGRGISTRNKNSIESLSEDSGYCDHLQHGSGGSMSSGGGLRARSKSLTNFGSAENITFTCGNGGGMFPSTLLPVSGSLAMTPQQPAQQHHEQQQPLSLDCIVMEPRHVAYHENRLSTVCDVDEEEEEEAEVEEEEEEEVFDDGCRVANCIMPPVVVVTTIDRQHPPEPRTDRWTNINNGTKIAPHSGSSCKQRPNEGGPGLGTVTSMASSSRSQDKNSPVNGRRARMRPVLSLSAPDLLFGADRHRRSRRHTATRVASTSAGSVEPYDPISFTVSSVPECLNVYGGLLSARSPHGSLDSVGASSDRKEFLRHGLEYGYGGARGESVASKNFNLYDLQQQWPHHPQPVAPVKCSKTVTFQTSAGSIASPARPKQNIRASYRNLTALNYSDDEEDDPVFGGRRGHEYYLSRNTFRTSSGTRLGGGGRTTHTVPTRTTLLAVPMEHGRGFGGVNSLSTSKDMVTAVVEEELAGEDEEESSIFPVDRDEKSVFNSLLEEMSAHFDRNLSIINDQAEAYEPIAAFLHEQRSTTGSSGARLHPTLAAVAPPQAPPRRTQIKTNPHHPQQTAGSPSVVKVTAPSLGAPSQPEAAHRRATFDQDPTNLVTCYAASLERCTFDPTESSTISLGPASESHTDDHIVLPRYVPVPVKREFVASTPNLHYYHGAPNGDVGGEDARLDHHNSLRNVSSCRSTGSILATASSSRCGLSKGVSFCPIVSEIIWKSTGSSDLDPDDNGSIISNQDFEIDIDEDDFEVDDLDHANLLTQTNTIINSSSGDIEQIERIEQMAACSVEATYAATPSGDDRVRRGGQQQRNDVCERDHTNGGVDADRSQSHAAIFAMIREDDGCASALQHPTLGLSNGAVELNTVNGGVGAGVIITSTSSDVLAEGDPYSDKVPASGGGVGVYDQPGLAPSGRMSDHSFVGGGGNGGVDERRNGGNGAMASKQLITSEQTRITSSDEMQHGFRATAATLPPQYSNNNSSLIKNFKNGKAEKKGKTFLSRISSGFRFSFRNKSKKGAGVGGVGTLKESPGYGSAVTVNNNNNINTKATRGGSSSASGNDSASADFIYIPLKDPRKPVRPDETPAYLQRQRSAAGVTVDDSFTGAEDEPDDCEIAVTRPGGYYRSDSSTALSGDGTGSGGNHVLSSKPPLPKQPPRVVGVCAKRSSASPASLKHGHAQRASATPPRDSEHVDELDASTTSSFYQRRSPSRPTEHQYVANGSHGSSYGGADTHSIEGSLRVDYGDEDEYYYGTGGDGHPHRGSIMGSEQKIGLIETNLDTHETVISGKTRSLMELGGGQAYRGYHQHYQQHLQQHQQPHQQQARGGLPPHGHQLQVHDPSQRAANGIKDHLHHRQAAGGEHGAGGSGRPHKSMEFLLDKENQRNVLPPENELQKSHETGTNLSEHQLRVQASLQRLNIPDWYKQYSGKDGPANTTAPVTNSATGPAGGILRKRNSDVGRWTGLSSKTTSLSSLGSHRSDRSPVMLSPSAHSHHGQTGFSRWSTSHLNSNQTSPSVSTRGSFTRGGLNASVISGYSTASTTAGTGANSSSTIRNSFRQPYLGWRSQEKLSQPRTPAERLASTLLQQQGTSKQQKDSQKGKQPEKDESVVTPEIQSSIIEVTSAIVHYVNDQTNRHSRSRSTSPSQRCWLESSFVGTRPLDSPQTPLIENSSVLGSGHQQQQQQPQTAGDHYRFNAGRMNGVGSTGAAVPTFSLPPEHQSPGSATLEDVLASLLGLPADSHRSSGTNLNNTNHTLQIEPTQARRRSEGDAAGTRKRHDSGGSGAISSSSTTPTTTTTTTSGGSGGRSPRPSGAATGDTLDARIARRVSLDSAETTGQGGQHLLRCRYPRCDATATLAEARRTYKSCHNCSHLYCSRECRRAHWERHRKACLHSRVSALCRLVLSTCKDDADTLRHLSALARRGYLSQGRGVVRILFRSPESADGFIKQGFQCLGEVSYVRWPDLLPAEMGPELYSELLKLSTEYKPDSKMLLYVAICVVSEAPGSATAPVRWERQLVSRCAKLKLCRSVANEIATGPGERATPRPDADGDVLVLAFHILSKTTPRAREQVSANVQTVLRQRGVNLRKHYPEVAQRLAAFVEGSTDRFLPVTLHPRDAATGRAFVCIIMPNYGDPDRVQFPVSENSDDRVVTIDVGADLGDDLTSKL